MNQFQPPPFLRGIEKSMIRKISDRARPDSISLGLGEPDLPTPEVIRREAIRVIQEERSGYTLQAGLPSLRERIAGDYPHMGLSIDQVIVTAGSQESLYLILRTLVEEGDEVLIPNPGFIPYPTIVRMVGGRAVTYRLPARTDFAFDIDDFKRKLSARTKVVICISPSNPTGRVLSAGDLRAMADAVSASGSNAFIVSDEIYRELYYTSERAPSISEFYPRTIVVSGLSKSMRMSCCLRPITRSFCVVSRWRSRCRLASMPFFFRSLASCSPGSSRPTTERSRVSAPRSLQFHATLAAPPSLCSSFVIKTTGTGASGEMRETSPNQ